MFERIVGWATWPAMVVLPFWLLFGSGLLRRGGGEGYEAIPLLIADLVFAPTLIACAVLSLLLRHSASPARTAFSWLTLACWISVILVPFFIVGVGDSTTLPSFAQRLGLPGSSNDVAQLVFGWGACALGLGTVIALGFAMAAKRRDAAQ
jgi:hypothetical protein